MTEWVSVCALYILHLPPNGFKQPVCHYLITHRESLWHKWHSHAGVMLLNHTWEKSTTEMVNTWSGCACRYQKHVYSQWCFTWKRHHCLNIRLQLTMHMEFWILVQWSKIATKMSTACPVKSALYYDQIMTTHFPSLLPRQQVATVLYLQQSM